MNITRTDIDALNATINLHFDESDYSELVQKELKKLRQKAYGYDKKNVWP